MAIDHTEDNSVRLPRCQGHWLTELRRFRRDDAVDNPASNLIRGCQIWLRLANDHPQQVAGLRCDREVPTAQSGVHVSVGGRAGLAIRVTSAAQASPTNVAGSLQPTAPQSIMNEKDARARGMIECLVVSMRWLRG